jgi:uncharacterized protein
LHVQPFSAIPGHIVDQVRQRLVDECAKHDARVLHAIESGSRAWGFASPDSDYDVRFLYAHRAEWYFSVFERRDVIETPVEEVDGVVFDVNGWDLRKSLRLLAKSNPVLIEWLRSPMVYTTNSRFVAEMLDLAGQYYSPRTAHYHYFLCGSSIKLKKYFYVLRPVLACRWIEQGLGLPPMQLTALLERLAVPDILKDDVMQLRERKMRQPELGESARIASIHDFLEGELSRLAAFEPHHVRTQDLTALDSFLRRWAA